MEEGRADPMPEGRIMGARRETRLFDFRIRYRSLSRERLVGEVCGSV